MVKINSSHYSGYENNNLSNIEFTYPNGTIIPSWLESGDIASFSQSPPGYTTAQVANAPSSTVTVSFWLRPVDNGYWGISGNYWENAVSGVSNSCGGAYYFFIEAGGNPPTESWSITNSAGNTFRDFPGVTVLPNQWQQFVGVYNGTDLVVYMNGVQIGNPVPATGPLEPSSALTISGNNPVTSSGGCNPISGNLADVQVYNTALSSSQIQELYSSGLSGGPVSKTNIVAWYPLAGNVKDYSGNNNNGVANSVIYSGVGPTSTNTTYWLKLGSIPGGGGEQVFMDFAPKSDNLFNTVNTGEAPQLSTTYGEYDDGANVFNSYWNFAGTTLPSGWTDSGSVTINNGVTIPSSSTDSYIKTSSTSYSPLNLITEFYVNANLPTSSGEDFGYNSVGVPGTNAFYWKIDNVSYEQVVTATSTYNIFAHGLEYTGYNIFGLATISSTAYAYVNYNQVGNTGSYVYTGSTFLSFENNYNGATGVSVTLTWLRTLAYPPNGVMPSAFVAS